MKFRVPRGRRVALVLTVVALALLPSTARAQLPILFYDFEDNASRTTFENAFDLAMNPGATPLVRSGNTTTITGVPGAGVLGRVGRERRRLAERRGRPGRRGDRLLRALVQHQRPDRARRVVGGQCLGRRTGTHGSPLQHRRRELHRRGPGPDDGELGQLVGRLRLVRPEQGSLGRRPADHDAAIDACDRATAGAGAGRSPSTT